MENVVVKIVESDKLDYEEFVRLHRFSFTHVLDTNRSKEIQNLKHFVWKYNPPAGKARIAIIQDGARIIAANSMIPLHVTFNGERQIAWQSCDTATDPEARGRGYFSLCIEALADSLKPGEIFFGFPNKNSFKGFSKLGWTENEVVSASCCLTPMLLNFSRKIHQVHNFDSTHSNFLESYSKERGPCLEKSVDYLNWRYCLHPKPLYSLFVYSSKNGVEGVLVLRKVTTERFSFSLVMEVLAVKKTVRHELLKYASYWGVNKRAWPVAVVQSDFSVGEGVFSGFVPVPYKLLPKRQVLMGMVGGHVKNPIFENQWHVQTGDWDGF